MIKLQVALLIKLILPFGLIILKKFQLNDFRSFFIVQLVFMNKSKEGGHLS